MEKLYNPHGRSCHLSTIPLKNFHMFKIVTSTYNKKKKKNLLDHPSNFKQIGVF